MKSKIRTICFATVAIVLALLLIEGFSSFFLFVYDATFWSRSVTRAPEKSRRQYDGRLGWTNLPDLDYQDHFGPGEHLATNSRGFRNVTEFAKAVPKGKIRIVCSGDSFTYGVGVGNENTWVKLLERKNDHVETVNLGVGGYGVDQAYLRYLEAARELDHHIHIFALITSDFDRMRHATYYGYGKPGLRVDGDRVSPTNVPVPYRGKFARWATVNHKLFERLGTVRLMRKAVRAIAPSLERSDALDDRQLHEILTRVLAQLNEIVVGEGGMLVLVHLPTKRDYVNEADAKLRTLLRRTSREQGIAYIDLLELFYDLTDEQADEVFLGPGDVVREYEAGHYSKQGNRLIADALHTELLRRPESAKWLATPLSTPQRP